jgi:hypothetical protein
MSENYDEKKVETKFEMSRKPLFKVVNFSNSPTRNHSIELIPS